MPNPSQTNKDGQMSASGMEDIINSRFLLPELAAGSKFKWPSSSHFERDTPITSL